MRFTTGLALALVFCGCGPHVDPRVEKLAAGFDKNEKAFKAAGFPTAVEDLGLPPVAPEDDATPLLDQATKVGQAYDRIAVTNLLKNSQGKEALLLLAKGEARFRLFERASHKKGASLHRDQMSPLPMSSESVFSGVCLKAEALALTKDYAGMKEQLQTADRVLAILSPSPRFPVNVGPFRCKGILLRAVANCAANSPAEQLDELEAMALRQRDRMSYQSIVTDTVLSVSLGWKGAVHDELKEKYPDATKKVLTVKQNALLSQFYAAMAKLAPTIPLVISDSKVARNWDDLVTAATPYPGLKINLDPRPNPSPQLTLSAKDLVPDAPLYADAGLRSDSVWKSTVALIKVLQFRAAKGVWPKSLAQIPGDWSDPFGHGNLVLRIKGDRIYIYSLGKDGVDGGGYEPGQKVINPGVTVEIGKAL